MDGVEVVPDGVKEYLTIRETAERLGITMDAARHMCRLRILPGAGKMTTAKKARWVVHWPTLQKYIHQSPGYPRLELKIVT